MPRLGAHLSAAGGWHRAVEAAAQLGCESVQLFLRPPGRWELPARASSQVEAFRAALASSPVAGAVFAHAPYLVNLASADPGLASRSVLLLVEELALARELGLAGVVVHPGSGGRGFRRDAAARARARLEEVLARAPSDVPLILENTAGAGGLLAARIRELRDLGEPSWWRDRRLGVCLDTAHLWAAGYDLLGGGWEDVWDELDQAELTSALMVLHINDTPEALGSGRDRHAPPGEGVLGQRFFANLLTDSRLGNVPCVMEIPPGPHNRKVEEALSRVRSWQQPRAGL